MGHEVDVAWVDLFWLPLGAGGHVVRWTGHVYEWMCAQQERRSPADLFHCALELRLHGTTYAVEMGPVWDVPDPARGVLVEGPVGSRWLGRSRWFRYEVRCWPWGRIQDLTRAVDVPVRTTAEPARVAAVLGVLRDVPVLTWGRDELGTGEMWNSNSLVAWALARAGHDVRDLVPPRGGRAPGWGAGLVLADRQSTRGTSGDAQTGVPTLPSATTRVWRPTRWFERSSHVSRRRAEGPGSAPGDDAEMLPMGPPARTFRPWGPRSPTPSVRDARPTADVGEHRGES